jgi:hypothetical protein
MLPTPPARRHPSGTAPAASNIAGANTPDRIFDAKTAATLKSPAGPADQRPVSTPRRLLLPFAAFAVLAMTLVALTPSRAAADGPPLARTDAVTDITATTATFHGFVVTGGRDVAYAFRYGVTSYDQQAPAQAVRVGQHAGGPVQVPVAGLAPATLYHVRLVVQTVDRGWHAIGQDRTFTTLPAPVAAPPVAPAPAAPAAATAAPAAQGAAPTATLGTSVVVAPVKGTVLVKVPGAADYAPLGANGAVPVGAVLDTRNGQVALTTALPGGKTQTATFERGVFQVRQSKTGKGLTDIYLRGPAPACGTSRASGRAAAVTKKKPKRRQLWGRDRGGRFRTHGSNSVATVRGTSWITTDTCSGTRTTVKAGAVSVRDIHRHRTVLVRAGHSYLARRR